MGYQVFAQTAGEGLPVLLIQRHAEAHFGLTVTTSDGAPDASRMGAPRRLILSGEGTLGSYAVSMRPNTGADVALAREAEVRGRAAGMGDLAARCRQVWLVEPSPESPEWLTWECCALLAFAALGPILPPDHSTLLGVKSARERAARLRPRT